MTDERIHLLGIRHHGPGSAYSVLRALAALEPDAVLIEGPEELDESIAIALHKDLVLPAAQLIYQADERANACLYPHAEFSPELQASRYALARGLPLIFIDLPQRHRLALAAEAATKAAAQTEENQDDDPDQDDNTANDTQVSSPAEVLRAFTDPLGLLAEAAGFDDGETWWEHFVEHRQNDLDVFTGIAEAMTTVREHVEQSLPLREDEALREAWMRRCIRKALKDGHQRIAVICGAWHVPALQRKATAKDDNELLKGLPKVKTVATWVPWTFGRLCFASGYGAGLRSPGWYQHLWELRDSGTDRSRRVAAAWLVHTAELLRNAGFDASSANIIEAVRLSESLAAMRDKPLPGLPELEEATLALLTFGAEQPLGLIREQLIVGERLGAVPAEVPQLPLQQDLAALQKKLRLPPKAETEFITLDLRKEIGLARSQLLHRLNLLDIPWGKAESVSGRGTFKEAWQLQWQPEFAVKLIEASVWGVSVETAADARACDAAGQNHVVAELAALLDTLLLADLNTAIHRTVARLNDVAAVSSDLMDLMQALLPLARVARYGNVRGADAGTVEHVLEGMLVRIGVGLYGACGALDESAASAMVRAIDQCHSAVGLLQNPDFERDWYTALGELSASDVIAAPVAGRATRILLGAGALDTEHSATRFRLALSIGNELSHSAGWLEGFLSGSGMLLVHEETLWDIVDSWLCRLNADDFIALLPLIRRTFSSFSSGEIGQLAQRVKYGAGASGISAADTELDTKLAAQSLPVVAMILGLESTSA